MVKLREAKFQNIAQSYTPLMLDQGRWWRNFTAFLGVFLWEYPRISEKTYRKKSFSKLYTIENLAPLPPDLQRIFQKSLIK